MLIGIAIGAVLAYVVLPRVLPMVYGMLGQGE